VTTYISKIAVVSPQCRVAMSWRRRRTSRPSGAWRQAQRAAGDPWSE